MMISAGMTSSSHSGLSFPTNPRAGPPLAKSLPVTAIEPSGEAQERGGLGYKQPYIMEADMASHYLPLPHVRGIEGDT